MARRKRESFSNKLEDLLIDIVTFCALIVALYLLALYWTDKAAFWRDMVYGVIVIIVLVTLGLVWCHVRDSRRASRWSGLLQEIKQTGQEDYIKNFINRFGFESRNVNGWTFRNHRIDWDRINDLEKELIERGVHLRIGNDRDIYGVLRHYVQEKEESLTRESIKREPQRFSTLSGSDFEKLLYQLFEAMGYKVEWIGKSGDQGGDLIANKDGERVLIQAKCYRDWSTGNAAVQQVVGAMKHYDCNKTMVVTTSTDFTSEAHVLAKDNYTELISKQRLSEMLLQYLGESWN